MLAKDLVNEQSAQQKIALLFVEILECAQRYSEGHCSPQKGFLDKGKTYTFLLPSSHPVNFSLLRTHKILRGLLCTFSFYFLLLLLLLFLLFLLLLFLHHLPF